MNSFKLNSFQKFACLVLIVILVIATVGFAADGWQFAENLFGKNEPSNDNQGGGGNADNQSTSDENQNINAEEPTPTPPAEPEKPVFISPATGLEVSEIEYNSCPMGVVVDPNAPIYGISNSDISIEFPTENGGSRLLAYSVSEEIMWKIGALKSTRNFISNMSNFFGGVVVSYGKDDIVSYDVWETDKLELDISSYSDCYYIENTLYVYTSEELIDDAKSKASASVELSPYKNMPYTFSESGESIGNNDATAVRIPYAQSNETQLYYNEASGQYLYYKNGSRKIDMLTGKNLTYTNLFILFADTTTYESAEGSELVIDTISGGKGYYISRGKLVEFYWSTDRSGSLQFKNLMGELLSVNRGNSYISYCKVSAS